MDNNIKDISTDLAEANLLLEDIRKESIKNFFGVLLALAFVVSLVCVFCYAMYEVTERYANSMAGIIIENLDK